MQEPTTPAELSILERRIWRLSEGVGLVLTSDEVRRVADSVVRVWQSHVQLDPEAILVLERLRPRNGLALVSNFDHPRHVREVLAELSLVASFDSIVISGEVGVKKPDPRIFDEVLASLRLTPKDCVYVGDTWEDVVCAREAGLRSIMIDRGPVASQPLDFQLPGSSTLEQVQEDEEVEVVRRLRDLIPLLT